MKKTLFIHFGLMVCLLLAGISLKAQQYPVTVMEGYAPSISHPAYIQRAGSNYLNFQHSESKLGFNDLVSGFSLLQFRVSPEKDYDKMSWGGELSLDREFIYGTLRARGNMAWNVLYKEVEDDSTGELFRTKLNLGGFAGIINQSTDFTRIKVRDREDPVQVGGSTFELDLGASVWFSRLTPKQRISLGATLLQLPGNMLTEEDQLFFPRLSPHVLASGQWLIRQPNLEFGPSLFFRFAYGENESFMDKGILDANLIFKFPEQHNLWFGSGYRLNNAAVNLAAGLTIMDRQKESKFITSTSLLDLNLAFSLPINNSSVFGPTLEGGLVYRFGRSTNKDFQTWILEYDGPFWSNAGNLASYTDQYLYNPEITDLDASVEFSPDSLQVTLQFEWNDPYVGYRKDEWHGVPEFMRTLAERIVSEALHPTELDSTTKELMKANGLDPNAWGKLTYLDQIQVACSLKSTAERCMFGDANMKYTSEWDTLNSLRDYIRFNGRKYVYADRLSGDFVNFNGTDTLLTITPGAWTSNLDLSYLKLVSIRFMLMDELARKSLEAPKNKWMKMRIIPDNPHQVAFQRNSISLRFGREKPIQTNNRTKRKR